MIFYSERRNLFSARGVLRSTALEKNKSFVNIMRNYAKVGGKPGKPGYRTSSSFQARVFVLLEKFRAEKL